MKIQHFPVTIRDVTTGYEDKGENGVLGYGGILNIRPPYQREFIYKDKARDAVIETILKGFPLNTMYWAINSIDRDKYEVLDGQQRTISFCQYVAGDFSILINGHHYSFGNLSQDKKDLILDYPLMVYVCEGTDDEKLEWFKTINIAGLPLKEQEMRNAIYTGPWLSDAKRYFSRNNGPAYRISKEYVSAEVDRQGLLEKAIKWISNGNIEEYMAQHQADADANDLWNYFRDVISWIGSTFTKNRKEMKSVDWGPLYDAYHGNTYDPAIIEQQVSDLMQNDEVTKKSGVYSYILSGDERSLSVRQFLPGQKREQYEKQGGRCAICGKPFDIDDMHADHIVPWSKGGKTVIDNCQVLCATCNIAKSNKP